MYIEILKLAAIRCLQLSITTTVLMMTVPFGNAHANECFQNGGNLICVNAEISPWKYDANGNFFGDEKGAYDWMVNSYPADTVFTVVQDWGMSIDENRSERGIRTRETKSYRECPAVFVNRPEVCLNTITGIGRSRFLYCKGNFTLTHDIDQNNTSAYCVPPLNTQNLGACGGASSENSSGKAYVGNPINIGIGNKVQVETDFNALVSG